MRRRSPTDDFFRLGVRPLGTPLGLNREGALSLSRRSLHTGASALLSIARDEIAVDFCPIFFFSETRGRVRISDLGVCDHFTIFKAFPSKVDTIARK